MRFPDGFLWGAATASYQIEGAVAEDGRGPSVWDTFSHTPGKVARGETGDVACDHYHRLEEDVALMADLGLRSYRFSVAWPRVIPDGDGAVNPRGLDFYDRLVDALLARGIVPALTLYHWDLPQPLQDAGGWGSRATVDAFVRYAGVVAERLADRVPLWITHNEPSVVAVDGHIVGEHAPGLRDERLGIQVAHNLLVSHGLAVPVLRAAGARDVGITINVWPQRPATDTAEDRAAADLRLSVEARWYLDPLFGRGYPGAVWDVLDREGLAPVVVDGDLETIAVATDFLGLNYYSRSTIRHDDADPRWRASSVHEEGEYTQVDWLVVPEGLEDLLTWVHREYAPPALYVTENGAAFPDIVGPDGTVHDDRRVAYLDGHFRAAGRAIAAGVPLRGYFVWSLLDNFEWALGYDVRFGIVRVDFDTLARTPKDSFRWYREVIAANGPGEP